MSTTIRHWRMLLFGALVMALHHAEAAQPAAPTSGLALSPDLLALLRAEMREVTTGVQALPLAIAAGDWHTIGETSETIRASYIMERTLTPAQAEELEAALPARFKELDARFHQRAAQLGAAAAAQDAELVSFHFSRMLEGCAGCHAAFASTRFPAFSTPAPATHHH